MNTLQLLTGVSRSDMATFCPASRRRAVAFAFAMVLPMAVWGVAGWFVAAEVFDMRPGACALTSFACVSIVYAIERLIQLSPGRWFVVVARLVLALLVSFASASAMDPALFGPEIAQQLQADAVARMERAHREALDRETVRVASLRREWQEAVGKASCESDGSCGTGRRSVRAKPSPAFDYKASQSEVLRRDYDAAVESLERLRTEQAQELTRLRASDRTLRDAGLVARGQALATYLRGQPEAATIRSVFAAIIVAMELAVLVVKIAFGETLDDRLLAMREALHAHQAKVFFDARTSPFVASRDLIERTYGGGATR